MLKDKLWINCHITNNCFIKSLEIGHIFSHVLMCIQPSSLNTVENSLTVHVSRYLIRHQFKFLQKNRVSFIKQSLQLLRRSYFRRIHCTISLTLRHYRSHNTDILILRQIVSWEKLHHKSISTIVNIPVINKTFSYGHQH